MKLTFLGTNGWYSTQTGNTICALLESEKCYVVFDAGDGIWKLDRHIKKEKPIFIFLSHLHLDHTFGFHIFPKFKFGKKFTVLFPKELEKSFLRLIDHPYAMPFREMKMKVKTKILPGDLKNLPFRVEHKKLFHVDPSFGYRLEIEGKSVAYCSDTGKSQSVIDLARGADILVHECAASPGVVSGKWGHSNPEEAARAAKKAGAKKLFLTHFSANSYQKMGDRAKAQNLARKIFKNTFAARDGMAIKV